MIGNDIVDLEAAAIESNWRRRGFLDKLFTAEEQEKILTAPSPDLYVWLLWSTKEAAYKAHQRQYNLKRNYRPKRFHCTVLSSEENSAEGKVRYGEDVYLTQSIISNRYVHTTASSSEGTEIISKILPSAEHLKSTFISHLAGIKNYCKTQITLEKDNRSIPQLIFKGRLLDCSFSLSHHGKFSAYALSLMNY